MPLWWDMAYYCLNLRDGTIRHFPEGSYNKQMATQQGLDELSAMETVYFAWRTFKTPAAKWGDLERRISGSIMPQPPEPTRRLSWLIAWRWGSSLWVRAILRQLRGENG